jgi:hypothetical protein
MDASVKVNHVVVSDTSEASFAVPFVDVLHLEVRPFRCGTAMDDDFIDLSHESLEFRVESLELAFA